MQPVIGLAADLERDVIVFPVVASDGDLSAAGQGKAPGFGFHFGGSFPAVLCLAAPQITFADQLVPDQFHLLVGRHKRDLVAHRAQILDILLAFFELDELFFLAGLRLGVFFIIILGVPGGGKAFVQFDRHRLAVVITDHGDRLIARFRKRKVRVEQFPLQAVNVCFFGLLDIFQKPLFLQQELVRQRGDAFRETFAFLHHPVRFFPVRIEIIQRVAALFEGNRPAGLRQFLHGEDMDVHGASVFVAIDSGRDLSRQDVVSDPQKRRDIVLEFVCGGRAQALDLPDIGNAVFGGSPKIDAVLGRGRDVQHAGQDLPVAVDVDGDPLDRVDDLAARFVCQDQVAVFAHDFADQLFVYRIPHFVDRLEMEYENALRCRLGHVKDTSSLQMFAQQHAEVRRFRRILVALFRIMHAGALGRRADQQFSALTRRGSVELQDDRIRFGLLHAFDLRALQFPVQLSGDGSRQKSVVCHKILV